MPELATSVRKAKSVGKGRLPPCLICGEDRVVDSAHFPTPKSKGGAVVIPLCPTHHNLVDEGRASLWEFEAIWLKKFADAATTLEEFFEWAQKNGYSYTYEDIRSKLIWTSEPSRTR